MKARRDGGTARAVSRADREHCWDGGHFNASNARFLHAGKYSCAEIARNESLAVGYGRQQLVRLRST